ncbi:MAG: site-specific integrase [Mogibacterium sp.]|nr:site-specific integrase [Mogibacterium sp.]
MTNLTGVFQLENGNWGYRFAITKHGHYKNYRRTKDDSGKPFKTCNQAARARQQAIIKANTAPEHSKFISKRTFTQVFNEYCEKGRAGKAYSTIRKQDSLWNNHIKPQFGNRLVSDVSVAEITDYLSELYYTEGRAYKYVESFVKVFYLIFGQAYSRNYLSIDAYNKLCVNKDTKIRMPKRKVDDDDDVIVFSEKEMKALDEYFIGTTLETAYMLGKYCGLRINECFGIKWSDIDFDNKTISISRQMQYQQGVIKLVSVKTRNGKRIIYMAEPLFEYLSRLKITITKAESELREMRTQQQMMIPDIDGSYVSSLELVNTLPNGKMRTVNSMKRHTRKIRDELGICFRFHYLRHTYGTRLAEMNTPSHILCNQMGHASSKVTEKYYLSITNRGVDQLINNLNSF